MEDVVAKLLTRRLWVKLSKGFEAERKRHNRGPISTCFCGMQTSAARTTIKYTCSKQEPPRLINTTLHRVRRLVLVGAYNDGRFRC